MLGITHIVNTTAIVSTPLLFGYGFDTNYLIFIGLVLFGCLLPDIDEPNSIIGKRFGFISYPINIIFGHRTITHNLIFITAISIYFYTQNHFYLFSISLGMLIHILQDSLTYQGINGALFPFQRYNYNFVLLPRFFRFAVGSLTEYVILTISVIYLLTILYTKLF